MPHPSPSRSAGAARSSRSAHALARGLGWFSIGIGLAELVAPRAIARAAGMPDRKDLVRAYGLREIAAGIGILASRRPGAWVLARAGGDLLDLATLGSGVARRNPHLGATDVALAAVAAVTAMDVACARALKADAEQRRIQVRDYRSRSGLPLPPEQMRGAARADFRMPTDMGTPSALRPYGTGQTAPPLSRPAPRRRMASIS